MEGFSIPDRRIYYRLIALWAICEAMLGGIIHGLRIPVSGLLIGSCAVICVSLIAWYVPERGAILKATVLVAVFKLMLSPQSPPAAYMAVFFQGLAGELLFMNRKNFKASCLLFGSLALFESGIQRILVLTILYGTDFWKAVNEFISGLAKEQTRTNYSLYLGGGYVFLHILAGIFIGWVAGIIPQKIKGWSPMILPQDAIQPPGKRYSNTEHSIRTPEAKPKKRKLRTGLLVTWLVLLVLFFQAELTSGPPLLSSNLAIHIFVRSVLIVLTWYFLVAPLLMKLLKHWLEKQKLKSQSSIREILVLLPAMQDLIVQCWQNTADRKGFSKLKVFFQTVLVNALENRKKVLIVTGPVHSGKTTRLQEWASGRNDVYGILSPVIDSKRYFQNLKTGEFFPMEAMASETEVVKIGRYVFSQAAFDRAKKILRESIQEKSGWVVVDEIGPLELAGGGFSPEIRRMLNQPNENLTYLFVVRETLTYKVMDYFRFNPAETGFSVHN